MIARCIRESLFIKTSKSEIASSIHAGAVIGADGFGFVKDGAAHVKFPQVGKVVIEDDVEIGANTCIDRGSLETTILRRGVKLDNLIQIAHNVRDRREHGNRGSNGHLRQLHSRSPMPDRRPGRNRRARPSR